MRYYGNAAQSQFERHFSLLSSYRIKALLAACKPLILLDFHRSFNDTRTKKKDTTYVVFFFLGSGRRRRPPPFDLTCSGEVNPPCTKVFACGENACTAQKRRRPEVWIFWAANIQIDLEFQKGRHDQRSCLPFLCVPSASIGPSGEECFRPCRECQRRVGTARRHRPAAEGVLIFRRPGLVI